MLESTSPPTKHTLNRLPAICRFNLTLVSNTLKTNYNMTEMIKKKMKSKYDFKFSTGLEKKSITVNKENMVFEIQQKRNNI